ncbi:hypothetical protein C3L33_22600, partial [Rhododendron williamsianum]
MLRYRLTCAKEEAKSQIPMRRRAGTVGEDDGDAMRRRGDDKGSGEGRRWGTSVITVNCPDKTGLGYVSTDGKWCYIVFWVIGKPTTRWGLLKKRLIGVCPSCSSASGISFYRSELQSPKPPDVFLLKLCCYDRRGLLHDVTVVLCELELTIKRVKVSTTPDGRVMDLFFITDTRELLHTNIRQEDTRDCLKSALGDVMISCAIQIVGPEISACSQGHSFLPPAIAEDHFDDEHRSGSHHKGLLYDIMRTLKDYNIQVDVSLIISRRGNNISFVALERGGMFLGGKKIVDPIKQSALCSRIQMELLRPLRVALVSRGPDTELVVANPVELSGKGRPLVFYDITLALKMLNTGIFSAEIGRHMIGDREWEVYRILLDEIDGSPELKSQIEGAVWKMLMDVDIGLSWKVELYDVLLLL